jgi:hypothetical protein
MLPQKMILFSCNANNSDFLRYYPSETGHLSLLTTRSGIEVGHLDAVAWDKKNRDKPEYVHSRNRTHFTSILSMK